MTCEFWAFRSDFIFSGDGADGMCIAGLNGAGRKGADAAFIVHRSRQTSGTGAESTPHDSFIVRGFCRCQQMSVADMMRAAHAMRSASKTTENALDTSVPKMYATAADAIATG